MRSRTKESKLTLHAVVVFWLKQTKQRKHRVGTPSIPSRERTTPREPKFHIPTEVVDPLLRSDTSKAQEYLQGLLSAADVGYKTVLRRRPVPLTDGPPDDDYILCFNIGLLKIHSSLHRRCIPQNSRIGQPSRRLRHP